MSETPEAAAVRFAGVFRRHLSRAASIDSSAADILLHRKLVMVSILDALSHAVFPSLRNRDRVVRLLSEHVTWPDSSRISLPHLVRLLSRAPDQSLDQLRAFSSSRLSAWMPGRVVPLSEDPEPDHILVHLPHRASLDEEIAGVKLRHLQHAQLFYTYRNSIVHELRPPAHDLRLWDTPEPHYVHLTLLSGATTWQLQYSNVFLARVAAQAIEAVQAHLIRNNINVFDQFDSGEYWIAELNR